MQREKLTLPTNAHVHIMGLGGFGMSAIGTVMHELGYTVSGCDVKDSPLLAPFRERSLGVHIGHGADHLEIHRPDALVISSAVPTDHPEVVVARERDIPVFNRADVLGLLMDGKTGIAIAGTHGKTTTTAMIAHVLTECGLDPSYIIGGVAKNLGRNAHAGNGDTFVIEADEYGGMFLGLKPSIAVLTSLEMDHPDIFADMAAVRDLFRQFLELVRADGTLIVCADDSEAWRLATPFEGRIERVWSYGFKGEHFLVRDAYPNSKGGYDFTIRRTVKPLFEGEDQVFDHQLSTRIPGLHNVLNATAAFAVALTQGIAWKKIGDAIATFEGVGRRFEILGTPQRVTVIDDYAHHPTAIATTLAGARVRYPEASIWAVWQPHTFGRTKILLDEFAASFDDADHVIITDIFRSRDASDFGISPQSVLDRIDHPDARHLAGLDTIAPYLVERVKPGDLVIVMSAGDATIVSRQLVEMLGTLHD